jgi:hypothetical protein
VALASNTTDRTTPPLLAVQIADALDSWTRLERIALLPRAVFNSGLKDESLSAERNLARSIGYVRRSTMLDPTSFSTDPKREAFLSSLGLL